MFKIYQCECAHLVCVCVKERENACGQCWKRNGEWRDASTGVDVGEMKRFEKKGGTLLFMSDSLGI